MSGVHRDLYHRRGDNTLSAEYLLLLRNTATLGHCYLCSISCLKENRKCTCCRNRCYLHNKHSVIWCVYKRMLVKVNSNICCGNCWSAYRLDSERSYAIKWNNNVYHGNLLLHPKIPPLYPN